MAVRAAEIASGSRNHLLKEDCHDEIKKSTHRAGPTRFHNTPRPLRPRGLDESHWPATPPCSPFRLRVRGSRARTGGEDTKDPPRNDGLLLRGEGAKPGRGELEP